MTSIKFEVDEKKTFEEFKKVFDRVVLKTHREVILNTPVDTGRLRKSIEGSLTKTEEGWEMGSNVPYAGFVELGTVNMEGFHMFQKGIVYFEQELQNELRN